jgi:hypothetical protein
MRAFIVSYRLRNGGSGLLHILARSSCEAIVSAIDVFADHQLQRLSARPA